MSERANWQAATLHDSDNVAVVLQSIRAGEDVVVKVGEGVITITALEAIALCHKIALVYFRPGDAVIKYGECIGEAIAPITCGACVHVHNLRSRRARAARLT